MLTKSLLQDARSTIRNTFQGAEHFSCLTGSILNSKTPGRRSDVDIVVVLPNEFCITDAARLRTEFTRRYIELHRSYGRSPDISWPGEVLYVDDLDRALEGAVFDAHGHADSPPPLCPPDLPYRYWTSMIATGWALTGTSYFIYYANRFARLIAWHSANYARRLQLNDTSTTMQHYWSDKWHLPSPVSEIRMCRVTTYLKHHSEYQNIPSWDSNAASKTPILEKMADQWRSVAHQHWIDLEKSGETTYTQDQSQSCR